MRFFNLGRLSWGLVFGVNNALALNKLPIDPSLGFAEVPDALRLKLQDLGSRPLGLNKCQLACTALSALLPDDHTQLGQSDYNPLPYWSIQQADLVPNCRIDVSSAKSLSTVVQVARISQCPFTVKSGGHAAFAGGSSIEDGILINLERLNSLTVSADRKTVSIGSGQRWYDVYLKLDPLNLSVVGGREAGVGVGGLLLGGGISYFSGKFGYGCDNVENYEVVLASGEIVNASPTENPDLYWALRGGGGSNFGIVSRFDLATFEQGLFWAGNKFHPIQAIDALAKTFENFNLAAPKDPDAHLYIAITHAQQLGGFAIISGPAYRKPVADAPIFDELKEAPTLFEMTSVGNMSRFAAELNQTAYQRQIFKTVTFKSSAALMSEITKIYQEEVTSILDVEGLFPSSAFQPISTNILEQMQKNGGNALGLTVNRGPLMIMNLNFGWDLARDDARVEAAASRLRDRAVASAKTMKLDDPFIYMNYASLEQPVYEGYGAENLARLQAIKMKYDPGNVFGSLWKGYFKL